jgi:hypothetical protein
LKTLFRVSHALAAHRTIFISRAHRSGVSLLAAQLLAGIGTNGINLGKRDLTDAEMRGFFGDLWNNALRPPIENALSGRDTVTDSVTLSRAHRSGVSLLAAQVLAGIGTNGINLGKRDLDDAELRTIADAFTQAVNNIFSNVIQKPLEGALSGRCRPSDVNLFDALARLV